MTKRKHISLETKLAAALIQMKRVDENGELVPIISHDEAKRLTSREICAMFDFDHCVVPHAEGGVDEAWNLAPVPRELHRAKTAKEDIPRIARNKRITKSQEEFRRRLLAKDAGDPKPRSKWPSRPFPKRTKRGESRTEA